MPVNLNESGGNVFEASGTFSNLSKQDLTDIRIRFNFPNYIEILLHGQFQMVDFSSPGNIYIQWIWDSVSPSSLFYRYLFLIKYSSFRTCFEWVGPIGWFFFVMGICRPTWEIFVGYIPFNVPSDAIGEYSEPLKEVLFLFSLLL